MFVHTINIFTFVQYNKSITTVSKELTI